MGDVLTFLGVVLMLSSVCYVCSMILKKNLKEFRLHFGLSEGFEISGAFYNDKETHNE